MYQVRLRESKFGMALVIESSELSGGYILGFRIDPLEKLQEIQREIASLHKLYSATPIFGVEYETKVSQKQCNVILVITFPQDELPKPEEIIKFDTMDDINEIDDTNYESQDAFAAYLADGGGGGGGGEQRGAEVVFCRELGVAMEKIKDGFTLESLWSVLPPEPNKKALLD